MACGLLAFIMEDLIK